MVVERIRTAPSTFTLHAPNPAHDLEIGGDWMAFGSVGSAAERRRPRSRPAGRQPRRLPEPHPAVPDAQRRSTSSRGYPVEPIDIHASIRHLDAIYDLLTLADKPIHAYSLGRQRNTDAIEMARIARGIDEETLDREPSIFTVINSSSPLRLDTPMLHGILEFSARNQVIVHDAVHARGRDGAGDARRRARRSRTPRRWPGWS